MKTSTSKRAIIIGASSGIGQGLTMGLLEQGYTVGITARRENLLKEIAEKYPKQVHYRAFDVTETDLLELRLSELANRLGGIDLLIVSAGLGMISDDLEYKVEKYALQCNVLGFTTIVNWAYNYFKKRGKGHIVGISSLAGMRGWRGNMKYTAAKAYQMNYMEGLRMKSNHEKSNVAITDIRPGYVQTDIVGDEYKFWMVEVKEVVPAMLKAIQRKKRKVYIPYRWTFIAFLYKIIPSWLYEKG